MLKLVIILLLLKPFAVFALEPTAGIVCNELNKKQNAEFLFKSDDEKIFSKVYKRINGKFKLVGNVVGRRMSSFILFEDNTMDKNIDFSWHLDEVTKNLRPFILSKKNKKKVKLPAIQSCISKNFWY